MPFWTAAEASGAFSSALVPADLRSPISVLRLRYTPSMLDFSGRRVVVMGLGRFGGGAGAARWLAGQGADVLVTDMATEDELGPGLGPIRDLVDRGSIELRLGEHNVSDFTTCDAVIANPAVPRPWDNRFLRAALAAGIPITTEIRLVVERIDRMRTIGVTGTAGKSTTTAMIHHVLRGTGHPARLAGNIGGSLLDELDAVGPDEWIVLELSSAQLHWLDTGAGQADAPGWSPHIAVLTNIAPNHLDWHGTFEHYERSKQTIFRHQQPGDHQVTEELVHIRRPLPLAIPGAHNQTNGFLALAAALKAAGVLPQDAAPALADFPGLPHRLQLVHESNGRRFFDDSKSTTPHATLLAVRAFKRASTVHLITGGYDKQVDLAPIAAMRPRLAGLYTIGATGDAIAEMAEAAVDSSLAGAGHLERCETLDRAVAAATARMADDDVLLLSPGCASWDQFTNYEERGERFTEFVRRTENGSRRSV